MNSKLSLIIPAYNEEANLPALFDCLEFLQINLSAKNIQLQAIVIDNSSNDETWSLLDEHVKTKPIYEIVLARHPVNLGMQQSLLTGLKLSNGDCVAVMQSDLQDPPEYILQMAERWQSGEKFVATKIQKREGSFIPRIGAWLFYRLLANVSDDQILPDSSDFYLFDSSFKPTIINKSGSTPFLRATLSSITSPDSVICYQRHERNLGHTNFNIKRRVNFALDALVRDLGGLVKKAVVFSLVVGAAATLTILVLMLNYVLGVTSPVAGWFSTMSVMLFILATTTLLGAIMLELLARIYRDIPRIPISDQSEIIRWFPSSWDQ